jgi:hypothetical protein
MPRQTWRRAAHAARPESAVDVRPWVDDSDPARELLPYVDNVSSVDLVSGYEHAAGFDVPGAYAGVVLDHFKFGDLAAYLTGKPDSAYWATRRVTALLGCHLAWFHPALPAPTRPWSLRSIRVPTESVRACGPKGR